MLLGIKVYEKAVFIEDVTREVFEETYPELEFCLELEISNIGNQNRSHFWHIAHNFWAVF